MDGCFCSRVILYCGDCGACAHTVSKGISMLQPPQQGRVPTFCKHFCLLSSHHFLHPAKLQVIVVALGVAPDTLGYATDRSRCSCTSEDLVSVIKVWCHPIDRAVVVNSDSCLGSGVISAPVQNKAFVKYSSLYWSPLAVNFRLLLLLNWY